MATIHHSHLALQMSDNLCEQNGQFWQEAEEATILSLQNELNFGMEFMIS